MPTTARLFVNGRSQAVRIPKSMAFDKDVKEVMLRKVDGKLILEPVRKSWTSLGDAGVAGDDFMTERPTLLDQDRVHL